MSKNHADTEKIVSVRNLVIGHPEFDNAYKIINNAYSLREKFNSPQNIICVGQSGTGKSTLKEKIKNNYPRYIQDNQAFIPVLVVDTPSVPTVKNLAEEMLLQLGDVRYNKGSTIEKTNRILNYMKKCDVKLLIFDELQHFIDQGKKRTPHEVSDWLKTVIDKAGASTILMGLSRCEGILKINEQLRRRFCKRIDIRPFNLNEAESRSSFVGVIKILDHHFSLRNKIDLKDKNILTSIYFATNGIIDYMIKLFIGAFEVAIETNTGGLSKECFYCAFKENIWVEGINKLNPFSDDFINMNLDKPGMPFHKFEIDQVERVE